MTKRQTMRGRMGGEQKSPPHGNPAKPPGNPPNKIVAATGAASRRSGAPGRGAAVQKAMEQAIIDGRAEGISEDELRERIRVAAKEAGAKFDADAAAAAEDEPGGAKR